MSSEIYCSAANSTARRGPIRLAQEPFELVAAATTLFRLHGLRISATRPTASSPKVRDGAQRPASRGLSPAPPWESLHNGGATCRRQPRLLPQGCKRTTIRVRLHGFWRLNHDRTCSICNPASASTASRVACRLGQRDQRSGSEERECARGLKPCQARRCRAKQYPGAAVDGRRPVSRRRPTPGPRR